MQSIQNIDNFTQSIAHLYEMFKLCDVVVTDSRVVSQRASEGRKVIFFALKGDNFDANNFVESVLESGAECVVTSRRDIDDKRVVAFDDTLLALQQLAAYHRKQLDCKVIAVTGSNGKTTTKELLVALLSQKYSVAYTKGNLNNHIGLPLTLLSIKESDDIAVVEHGANHIGEIEFLVSLSQPDYGLITNIGRAHIGEFGGINGTIKAKGELYDFLVQHNKTIFYNTSLAYLSDMIKERGASNMVAYSESIIEEVKSDKLAGGVAFRFDNQIVASFLIGSYNILNLSAAIVVAQYFGISTSQIKTAIESYVPSNMRSQLIETSKNRVVVDAYNANPSSMLVAIQNFAKQARENSLCILGEMHELGSYSSDEHRDLVITLMSLKLKAVLVGHNFEKAAHSNGISWFESVDDLIDSNLLSEVNDCDILVKGSRATSMERVLEYL